MKLCGPSEHGSPTPPQIAELRPRSTQKQNRPRNSLLAVCSFTIFVLFVFSASAAPRSQTQDPDRPQGVRVEVSLDSQVRIENQFGNVNVEITKRGDVEVAATISGGKSSRQSPVVIERRNNVLLISVAMTSEPLRGSPAHVNLDVRLPETVRAEIVTGNGAITSRGVSTALSLKTISGAIHTELAPLDVDLIAQSTEGRVRSEIGAGAGSDSHIFRSRFGAGRQTLRVTSQRGDIVLAVLPDSADLNPTLPSAEAPRLRGATNESPATGIPATQSTNEEVGEGDVIRVDTELVNMNFSVIDRGTNRGVAGLRAPDFKLFEDGVEQQLLHFDSSAAPFDLLLLIDLSGSTREVVKLIRAAARHFVDAARPTDRIAIVTFAAASVVVSPLTLDRAVLRERVEAIDTLHGDTKLYDASSFALSTLVNDTKGSRRTAIVMMSDGLDGSIPGVNSSNVPDAGSRLAYKDLLHSVSEFDGVVYSLWLNTYYEAMSPQDTQPEAFEMGHDRMRELAEAGGGVFYEVDKLDDLAGAYERVVADLGTVYSLAYRPVNKNRDGKWRSIHVVVDRPLAVARGKHGYYAN